MKTVNEGALRKRGAFVISGTPAAERRGSAH
jgi:hypothetical protein